jgi:transposase
MEYGRRAEARDKSQTGTVRRFATTYYVRSHAGNRTVRRGRPPIAKQLPEWEISDAFWKLVEPLIPQPKREKRETQKKRRGGGGRKPLPYRRVFEGILYVLRTGCQWNAIPKERFGAPSTIHRYFTQWLRLGFFLSLWNSGLAQHDEMGGIAWHWHAVDRATIEGSSATNTTGRNPTAAKGKQTSCPGGRAWHPAVVTRQRSDSASYQATRGGL